MSGTALGYARAQLDETGLLDLREIMLQLDPASLRETAALVMETAGDREG